MRVFLIFLALVLGITGVAKLLRGTYTYRNYWGGVVFVPVALVGSAVLLIGVFRIGRTPESSRQQRISRKQRLKEEEALRTRFPIDDFDKPWNGHS